MLSKVHLSFIGYILDPKRQNSTVLMLIFSVPQIPISSFCQIDFTYKCFVAGSFCVQKKKPDSSSEALSGEEVTPAKKGRNQAQTTAKTPRGGRGGKRGGRGRGRGNSRAAAACAAGKDDPNLRRSTRVRQARARRPPTSPSEESSEETEEETEEEEDEIARAKDFLDASFTPEEESGDEDFKPKGRNFQRQEARTSE